MKIAILDAEGGQIIKRNMTSEEIKEWEVSVPPPFPFFEPVTCVDLWSNITDHEADKVSSRTRHVWR